jgi:hypothetical protein
MDPRFQAGVECRNGRQVRGLFEDGTRLYGFVQSSTGSKAWMPQTWRTDGLKNAGTVSEWDLMPASTVKVVEQSEPRRYK